jgi:hypothetical protein
VGRPLEHHLGINECGLAHPGAGASLDAEEEDKDEDEEGEDGFDPAATEKGVSLRCASCEGVGRRQRGGSPGREEKGREGKRTNPNATSVLANLQ